MARQKTQKTQKKHSSKDDGLIGKLSAWGSKEIGGAINYADLPLTELEKNIPRHIHGEDRKKIIEEIHRGIELEEKGMTKSSNRIRMTICSRLKIPKKIV